ncbi:hypothetical protein GAYE_PCTG30G0716 [Galdieria yellowstonensis]|uniref:1-deoxy-D-xylulose 5-phosphate reductoisomerase, apicoplastic n=1 Tax=Galdieria yellowstonensis TaxID=3028027 RepID=A0AAV9I319_9RHOD|nr:hypothetical protein GAYE_PCTG30G0716 [Galdieria yellowstonensis]
MDCVGNTTIREERLLFHPSLLAVPNSYSLCKGCNKLIKKNCRLNGEKKKLGCSRVLFLTATTTTTGGKNQLSPVAPIQTKALNENRVHKKIVILGSTGSIGTQTLEIVDTCPENFQVVGLACGGSQLDIFVSQIHKYRPKIVAISDSRKIQMLRDMLQDLDYDCQIGVGERGLVDCASFPESDLVVTGIVGCAGLIPTVAAIKAGKDICLANKETLIAGGPVIAPLVEKHRVHILPADSEHSAIFQCLQGVPGGALSKLILTASGGAFRDTPLEQLPYVTLKDALKHPNWNMGAKITIDSATLMNKGLEVIEAHFLFGTAYDNIQVVVHPQSIIHSMIELCDTSVIAQMGWPDMRLPLLYAMSWPCRLPLPFPSLDLVKVGTLSFKEPDRNKYPCLDLAYGAGKRGGTMPAVLNAANEEAVYRFRNEEISYLEISKVIEYVMDRHENGLFIEQPSLEDILDADQWARKTAREFSPQLPFVMKHSTKAAGK